jgi:hypothetical protein
MKTIATCHVQRVKEHDSFHKVRFVHVDTTIFSNEYFLQNN